MYKNAVTLTDFLLEDERKNDKTTLGLTILLHQIENVTKIIAAHVKASGLVDIIGATGKTNVFGDQVQKLDEFSNKLLFDMLKSTGQVHALVSEEMEKEVIVENSKGDYIVYFDPLDGSSNVESNIPIGTIFSIYHKDGGLLQKGNKQIAAGYVLYGSSVIFVYTSGSGVNGFTLDPGIGAFLLSHPDIKIPKEGKIYSINEAYEPTFDRKLQNYLKNLKNGDSVARYVGTLAADAHRTFIKGGIFLHPASSKNPEGKLRLMLEVNPFAFLTFQAGGIALGANNKNPLSITPKHIHVRSPFVMGSPKNAKAYLSFQ
ncbi:MAG: fructose-1,6-bisphosphatase [Candidatus Levybacteria bacterium]|nr:fructose-1,6-bisphosphatase [Candidatus Levybacteria bacterium]